LGGGGTARVERGFEESGAGLMRDSTRGTLAGGSDTMAAMSTQAPFVVETPVNVLLIGGGGREHALAWAIARSKHLGTLYVTHPENPGLASLGEGVDVPVSIREIYRIEQVCRRHEIGLVVIGPEGPLADGFADALRTETCAVFGPGKEASLLEADKAWSKQLMHGASVPTAEARVFTDPEPAKRWVIEQEEIPVVKASGLARGKGVIVPETVEEAVEAIERAMEAREFGEAGATVLLEERLTGPEVSVFALLDGSTIYVLETCQDYKRLGEGDTGPNTGGMGAFCPSSLVDEDLMDEIQREVLVPVADALKRSGVSYQGVLYAGLMLTHSGPKVLEFNVRFGDPECQVLMPRLESDVIEIMLATATHRLRDVEIRWRPGACCGVVLASGGYPGEHPTGLPIEGIDRASSMEGVEVFHAGTRRDKRGRIVTAGGRVLTVTGVGETLEEARRRVYEAADLIEFEGKTLRGDIGSASRASAAGRARG